MNLALEFGLHRQTVMKHLNRAGVETRYRVLSEPVVAHAVELYAPRGTPHATIESPGQKPRA